MPARHFVLYPRYRIYVTGIGQTCYTMPAVSRPGNKTIARPLTCTRWTLFGVSITCVAVRIHYRPGRTRLALALGDACHHPRTNRKRDRARLSVTSARQGAPPERRRPGAHRRISSVGPPQISSRSVAWAGPRSTSSARTCRILFSGRFSPVPAPRTRWPTVGCPRKLPNAHRFYGRAAFCCSKGVLGNRFIVTRGAAGALALHSRIGTFFRQAWPAASVDVTVDVTNGT
jgi:hypothetical protein